MAGPASPWKHREASPRETDSEEPVYRQSRQGGGGGEAAENRTSHGFVFVGMELVDGGETVGAVGPEAEHEIKGLALDGGVELGGDIGDINIIRIGIGIDFAVGGAEELEGEGEGLKDAGGGQVEADIELHAGGV